MAETEEEEEEEEEFELEFELEETEGKENPRGDSLMGEVGRWIASMAVVNFFLVVANICVYIYM